MKTFTESMRYDYSLTPESLVLDIGANEGIFALEISKRYGCWIVAFEPVHEFYEQAKRKLADQSRILLFMSGVGGKTRDEVFGVKGTMTGKFTGSPVNERVKIRDVTEVFDEFGLTFRMDDIDLVKINIEGGEYELLDRLIQCGLHNAIRNIQVQWHSVIPNCHELRNAIEAELEKTHKQEWDNPAFDTGWSNWRRQ